MKEERTGKSELEQALYGLVLEKGRDVYRNANVVAQYLREKKVPLTQIRHVELILADSELLRYLEQMNEGLTAVECNNILLSAEATGLSDQTIRTTVEALLGAMSVPQILKKPQNSHPAKKLERKLYVPPREYELYLIQIEKKINGKIEPNKEEYSLLEQFVLAGIPRACRLLGQVILCHGEKEQHKRALELLEYAQEYGDAEAAAVLADYYAETNGKKAHELYTRPGALAMDEKRRSNFRGLKEKLRGRNTQLWMIAGVFLAVQAVIWLLSGIAAGSGSKAGGTIYFWIANLNALGLLACYWRDPYRDLRAYTLPMVLGMFVYAMSLL